MKVLLCAYREWALECVHNLQEHYSHDKTNSFDLVETPKGFYETLECKEYDAIVLIGWSWIIRKPFLENNFIVGIHPSDLPEYAGGSPIQHQILDGVEQSNVTLFKITQEIDEGPTLIKKRFSLTGNMSNILKSISNVSFDIICEFLKNHPNHTYTHHDTSKIITRKRLKPEDSKLDPEDFSLYTTKELYNIIRCREDPYPNVYIEDENGRLYFKAVGFEKK